MNVNIRERSNSVLITQKKEYLGDRVPATIHCRASSAPIEGASSRSLAIFATLATNSGHESATACGTRAILDNPEIEPGDLSRPGRIPETFSSIDWSCDDTHAYTRAILGHPKFHQLKHMTRVVNAAPGRAKSEDVYEMVRLCQHISSTSSNPNEKIKYEKLIKFWPLSVPEFAISFDTIKLLKTMTPLEQETIQLQIKKCMKRLRLDPSRIPLEDRYRMHEEVKDLIKYAPSVKLKEKYSRIFDLLDLCMPTTQERLKELIEEINEEINNSNSMLYKFCRVLLSDENKSNINIGKCGYSIATAILSNRKNMSLRCNKYVTNIFIELIKYDSVIKNYNALNFMFCFASDLNKKNELFSDVIDMIFEITEKIKTFTAIDMKRVCADMNKLLETINVHTEKEIERIDILLKELTRVNERIFYLKMLLNEEMLIVALEKKFKDIIQSVYQLLVFSNTFDDNETIILFRILHKFVYKLTRCKSVVMDFDTSSSIYRIVYYFNNEYKYNPELRRILIKILNQTLKNIKYISHKDKLTIKHFIELLLEEIESPPRGNSRLPISKKMKLPIRDIECRILGFSSSKGQLSPVVPLPCGGEEGIEEKKEDFVTNGSAFF